jgi:hypothetical protein
LSCLVFVFVFVLSCLLFSSLHFTHHLLHCVILYSLPCPYPLLIYLNL